MNRRLARWSLVVALLLAPVAWRLFAAPPAAVPVAASVAQAARDTGAGEAPRERLSRRELRQRAEEKATAVGEMGRSLTDRIASHLPGVMAGVALFLVFWLFARISGRVLRRVFARAETDPALAQLALPLVRMSLIALGVLAAMEQMGFNIGSLLAGVGIAGLAIGLAAQETLSNLLGGFAILWDRPFRIGDSVTIGSRFGTVTEIGFRSTRLRTLEQMEVTIPNKDVAQQHIVNHSRYPQVRINVPFSIGYEQDVARVRSLLLAAVASHPEVLDQPAAQVVVTALGDSGVTLEIRLWVRTPIADSASLFHFLELAKRTLDEAGIQFPYPHRTLHLVGPVQVGGEAAPG